MESRRGSLQTRPAWPISMSGPSPVLDPYQYLGETSPSFLELGGSFFILLYTHWRLPTEHVGVDLASLRQSIMAFPCGGPRECERLVSLSGLLRCGSTLFDGWEGWTDVGLEVDRVIFSKT